MGDKVSFFQPDDEVVGMFFLIWKHLNLKKNKKNIKNCFKYYSSIINSKLISISGILPLDFPFSGLCDVIDVDEQYLGNPTLTPTKWNTSLLAVVVQIFQEFL